MFTSYKEEQVMTSDGNIYYLQYASFTKKDVMDENTKKLDNYIVKEEDGKYYVYIGVTTILENANRLKKIFENNGIYTYIKNDYLGNSEIINKIIALDKEIINEESDMKVYEKNQEIIKLLK